MQPIKVEDRIFQADRTAHIGVDRCVRGPVRSSRNRRRTAGRGRHRIFRGVISLSLTVAVIGGLADMWVNPARISSIAEQGLKLADGLAEKAGFGVMQISLKGHRYASDTDIFAALGQSDRRSIFGFDIGKARRSLGKLAWVERAHITRRFPDELLVEIVENRPFAVWRVAGKYWLIDHKGVKLAPLTGRDFAHLPFVTGAGGNLKIAAFEKTLKQFSTIKAGISSVSYIGGRRWTLNFKSGLAVHLPADNVRGALKKLNRLMSERHILDRAVASIDLRLNDRITLSKKPVQNAKAGQSLSASSSRQVSLSASVLTASDSAVPAPFQGLRSVAPASAQQTASGG